MKFSLFPPDGWEAALSNAATSAIAPYLKAAQGTIKDLWSDAYDHAESLASQRLHSTKNKYLAALKKVQTGDDTWTIILDKDAVYLEDGYSGYDMIDAGLASGGKAKFSKETGRRYVKIPFEHVQAFGNKNHPMNEVVVQQQSGSGTTKGDLASDLKRLKKIFAPNDSKISTVPVAPGFEGPAAPIMGAVWSIQKSPEGPQWEYKEFQTDMKKRMELEKQPSALLSGITKVQFQGENGQMKSKYLTWRTATDPRMPITVHSKPPWVHPGFQGVKIMKDVESYITAEFASRINALFSQGA